jgi:hypothetical protein
MSNIKKIGLTGSVTYENKIKIKEFIFNLTQRYGSNFQIISLGDRQGADKYIKKYALELGCAYGEMNPPHTNKNLYSLLNEGFYSKPFSPKYISIRDKIYASTIDIAVIFNNNPTMEIKIKNIVNSLNKANKKTVVIE